MFISQVQVDSAIRSLKQKHTDLESDPQGRTIDIRQHLHLEGRQAVILALRSKNAVPEFKTFLDMSLTDQFVFLCQLSAELAELAEFAAVPETGEAVS